MMNIHRTVDDAFRFALENLVEYGVESQPRGKLVRELLGQSISFDMKFPIVTLASRKIGYKFYPAEASWIIAGRNDVEYIKRFSPFVSQFSDDGTFYSGAYGPRVVDQLTYVCDMLSEDPDTRQAVIEVWRPNPRPGRDIPCTLSYQFLARDGLLHCVQSMRSSDAWLGYPYDAFNAAMLTGYIMLLLRDRAAKGRRELGIGYHTMVIGSQHLYEPQWLPAMDVIQDRDVAPYSAFQPYEFSSPRRFIDHLSLLAELEGVDPRKNYGSLSPGKKGAAHTGM